MSAEVKAQLKARYGEESSFEWNSRRAAEAIAEAKAGPAYQPAPEDAEFALASPEVLCDEATVRADLLKQFEGSKPPEGSGTPSREAVVRGG